ncbi:MAG: hypothetical protein QM698_13950 [Micropepsaceae bacterium]
MMRSAFLAAALVLLAACGDSGPLKIDGASKEAAEASIAAIGAALDPVKKAEFDAAMDMGWPLGELAGKTADDVIALARARMIATLKDETIPALQAAIPEAEKAVEETAAAGKNAKRFLAAISLLNPQFVWRDGAAGEASPLFTFNMKNDTSEAIQEIVFHATIGPRGDGKPWIDQRFTFKFAEAVTAGEEKFVFVTPDLTLPGNVDALNSRDAAPGDMSYGIDFVRVSDLNGRVIMDDEGEAKAGADLQAAKDRLAAAEAELKRLEAGGSIVPQA